MSANPGLSQLPPALLGSHSCQARVRHSVHIFSNKCFTHAQSFKSQQERVQRPPGKRGLTIVKRVLSTSTRSLSNFTAKVNSVHAKSPLGCGAPSQPDPVRERRHPTRTFAGTRACGSAGSANLKSTRPPSFDGGEGGGG